MKFKINIARFSGSVSVSGYQTNIDVNNNTSYVHVDITVRVSGSTYNTSGNAYISGTVSGQNASYKIPKTYFKINKSSSKVVYSGNIGPFTHNADGSCGNISVHVNCYISSSTKPSGNTTIGMSTIPRATGFYDVTGTIGQAITVNISPASGSFTHLVKYQFGTTDAHEAVWGNPGETSLTFTPPMELLQYMPNSQVGTGQIWLDTFNGNDYIGSSGYKALYLSADKNTCSPTISSAPAVDVNEKTIALTGNSKIIVNNASQVSVSISGKTKYYATVGRLTVGGTNISPSVTPDGVDYNVSFSGIVDTFNPSYPYCDLVDSRGFMDSCDFEIDSIVQYIYPKVNVSFVRTTPAGSTITVNSLSGSVFAGSFGAVSNTCTIKYRFKKSTDNDFGEWVDISDKITVNPDNNTFSKTSDTITIDGFDYRYQYVIELSCIDKLNTYTVSTVISQGLPVFYWDEDSLYDKSSFGLSGEILYNNPSGDSGTITLSQSAADFKRFKIFYRDADECYQSVDVYNPNGKIVTFTGYYTNFSNMFYLKYTTKTISSTTITANKAVEKNLQGTEFHVDNLGALIYITMVVGYR